MKKVFELIKHIYGKQNLEILIINKNMFKITNNNQTHLFYFSDRSNVIERFAEPDKTIYQLTHPYCINKEKEKFEAMINDTFFHKPKLFFAHSVYPSYCTTVTHLNKILDIEWKRILDILIEKYMLCTDMLYQDVSVQIMKFIYQFK